MKINLLTTALVIGVFASAQPLFADVQKRGDNSSTNHPGFEHKEKHKDKDIDRDKETGDANGAGEHKVSINHKGHVILVDQHAVQAHLDHGDAVVSGGSINPGGTNSTNSVEGRASTSGQDNRQDGEGHKKKGKHSRSDRGGKSHGKSE
jgi:hypothetical protein